MFFLLSGPRKLGPLLKSMCVCDFVPYELNHTEICKFVHVHMSVSASVLSKMYFLRFFKTSKIHFLQVLGVDQNTNPHRSRLQDDNKISENASISGSG